MSISKQRVRAERIMSAVLDIAAAIREERAELAKDPGSDATALAGCIAGELAIAGGQLEDHNVYRLKWPLDEAPRPIDDPEAHMGALGIASVLLHALDLGRRRGHRPQTALTTAATIWPEHKNKREADRASKAVAQAEADRLAQARARAHNARQAKPVPAPKPAPKAPAAMVARNPRLRDGMYEVEDFDIPDGVGGVG